MPNGNCECCGRYSCGLARHHWFEIPTLSYQEKLVCLSCNQRLRNQEYNYEGANHILPAWEYQVACVKFEDMLSEAREKVERIREKFLDPYYVDKNGIELEIRYEQYFEIWLERQFRLVQENNGLLPSYKNNSKPFQSKKMLVAYRQGKI